MGTKLRWTTIWRPQPGPPTKRGSSRDSGQHGALWSPRRRAESTTRRAREFRTGCLTRGHARPWPTVFQIDETAFRAHNKESSGATFVFLITWRSRPPAAGACGGKTDLPGCICRNIFCNGCPELGNARGRCCCVRGARRLY